jgi:hypothetical protein
VRYLAILALMALSIITVTPAAALRPDFEAKELSSRDKEYLRSVRPFADCLVAQNAKEIPKFLGMADNAWIGRAMREAHQECPAPKASNHHTTLLLAGAVLEALIRRDFGTAATPANFNHLPSFVYVKDATNKYIEQDMAILMEPYDCTTRRDPARVRALLDTDPLSGQEVSALGALRPTLVACHPKGETWEMQPYFARRFLAEAYYTLMKVDQRRKASAH